MTEALARAEREQFEMRPRLAALRRAACGERVEDHPLRTTTGEVRLRDLFDGGRDLIVVHNMGRCCAYCTLWADGLIGLARHLDDRARFVLVSADPPEVAEAFASERGWPFRVVSGAGSAFTAAMGFAAPDGSLLPGTSIFHLEDDGAIVRTGRAPFGPGDEFCAVWHFFDLLADGPAGWTPS